MSIALQVVNELRALTALSALKRRAAACHPLTRRHITIFFRAFIKVPAKSGVTA